MVKKAREGLLNAKFVAAAAHECEVVKAALLAAVSTTEVEEVVETSSFKFLFLLSTFFLTKKWSKKSRMAQLLRMPVWPSPLQHSDIL